MKIGDTTTPYIFYQDRYMDALDIYCDHLEKALDKSCVQLTQCRDCYFDCPFKDKCEDLCEYESKWKEWCLKDE